jgi:uncharacterized protein
MMTRMRRVSLLMIAVWLLVVTSAGLPSQVPSSRVAAFPLAQVRLLPGPFEHAQQINLRYLRALEPDRLLAAFRTEAGLVPKAEKYPNWEGSGLEGHTAGHYLTALAQMWAATGDAEMKRRLDYMVAELAACQRAHGDGYVGAIPGSRRLWTDVGAGRIKAEPFALNGKWVPWYNLHKLFAGLRDAHVIGGSAEAKEVLVRLTDWADALTSPLSDAAMQEMLQSEHGGMNEVLADVAGLTGDRRYLQLATRFSHRAVLDPLRRGEDALTGLHANTQIPKVVGDARIAELGGGSTLQAARFFWDTVVGRRSVAFGGNSVREHFNAPDDFSEMIASVQGPETCNTYNMLRLTEQLFQADPQARYADFYERALFNHILSSQHPEHGGFVYFTPIRPRHYRVYSQPSQCFWCCVGSGMENHGKHGQFIYARGTDTLLVNLFVASTLDWPERGIGVRQETTFPDEPRTRLQLTLERPQRLTVLVRHPGWSNANGFRVRVNGETWPAGSRPGSYAALTREWQDGDRIEVDLPMTTRVERLPDGSEYVALVHGPIVLAAKTGADALEGLIAGDGRMAHVASGPEQPLEDAPRLVGHPDALAGAVRPVDGRPLTFTAPGIIRPDDARDLELVPFFRVHDSRYIVYWRVVPAGAGVQAK